VGRPVTLKATAEFQVVLPATVALKVPDAPATTVRALEASVIEKLGAGAMTTVTGTLSTTPDCVALRVGLYVPKAVVAEACRVNLAVQVPEVVHPVPEIAIVRPAGIGASEIVAPTEIPVSVSVVLAEPWPAVTFNDEVEVESVNCGVTERLTAALLVSVGPVPTTDSA
jgi:hypothetical protein